MKGILFKEALVKAILDGRKNQTRRLAKIPCYDHFGKDIMDWELSEHPYFDNIEGTWKYSIQTDVDDYATHHLKAPYQIGETVYVKEKWKLVGWNWEDGEMVVEYADGIRQLCDMHDPAEDCEWALAKVQSLEDRGIIRWINGGENSEPTGKKWPFYSSLFMPKEAARIFLKIVDVRPERLWDITEEDAKNEGATQLVFDDTYKQAFQRLWESINGNWENKWVWRIKFEKI